MSREFTGGSLYSLTGIISRQSHDVSSSSILNKPTLWPLVKTKQQQTKKWTTIGPLSRYSWMGNCLVNGLFYSCHCFSCDRKWRGAKTTCGLVSVLKIDSQLFKSLWLVGLLGCHSARHKTMNHFKVVKWHSVALRNANSPRLIFFTVAILGDSFLVLLSCCSKTRPVCGCRDCLYTYLIISVSGNLSGPPHPAFRTRLCALPL